MPARAATQEQVLAVARNLRAVDRAELSATNPGVWRADTFSAALYRASPICDVVLDQEGRPQAVIGLMHAWTGYARAYAFGTDRWPSVVKALTKHTHRSIIPAMRAIGLHRADAYVRADRDDVRRWLASFGAVHEGTLRGFGSDRSDFAVYAWTDLQS